MALDTRNKRAAILSLMPEPDTLIDAGDRRQLMGWFRFPGEGMALADGVWQARDRKTRWAAACRLSTFQTESRSTRWAGSRRQS